LHLGHVANAIWTWGIARATGGTVLLRIEDHDRGRCRPDHEVRILQDLEWLGLTPDASSLHPLREAPPSPWRQSDCEAEYRQALEHLATTTRTYGCSCSRSQIARDADMGQLVPGREIPYRGTCRGAGLPAGGTGLGTRVVLPEESVGFTDLRLGVQQQRPAKQCGDLLLRDAVGNWTYQLAVTVDDLRHGVTLVVRGEDLLESTGRQILLGRLLGRETPATFLHHSLLRNDDGAKLSKRDQAVSLSAMRQGGASPASVMDAAAGRTGFPVELRWW
jgi:glutamyl-tRNA synthetase/glutamyl-Q tRNA(Asp) synthetase